MCYTSMTRENYVGASIPKSLADEIDEVINLGKYGFKSRAEFLKHAARDLIKKLED